MTAGICLLTMAGILGAWLLGIPILNILYSVDLQQEKPILMLVMVYGGLNAINIFTYYMIALTRSQKWLLIGYAAAALTVFILAPMMVRQYEMTGAILSSIISIALLDLILGIILIRVIRSRLREKV